MNLPIVWMNATDIHIPVLLSLFLSSASWEVFLVQERLLELNSEPIPERTSHDGGGQFSRGGPTADRAVRRMGAEAHSVGELLGGDEHISNFGVRKVLHPNGDTKDFSSIPRTFVSRTISLVWAPYPLNKYKRSKKCLDHYKTWIRRNCITGICISKNCITRHLNYLSPFSCYSEMEK